MRKSLTHFLVAILLMPALVCAMPVCPEQAEAALLVDRPHCDGAASGESTAPVMLNGDCTGVDMQQSPPPFQVVDPVFSAEGDDSSGWAHSQFTSAAWALLPAIRGSPPVIQTSHHVSAPVYLTTQRLRL